MDGGREQVVNLHHMLSLSREFESSQTELDRLQLPIHPNEDHAVIVCGRASCSSLLHLSSSSQLGQLIAIHHDAAPPTTAVHRPQVLVVDAAAPARSSAMPLRPPSAS